MAETCGGYCCERFRFRNGESPEALKKWAEDFPNSPDVQKVVGMVIHLGRSKVDVDGEEGQETHWYTCKNFDTETRLCKIYEQRPQMCRDFNKDWYHACGVKKCKLPPHPRPPEVTGKKMKLSIVEEEQHELAERPDGQP